MALLIQIKGNQCRAQGIVIAQEMESALFQGGCFAGMGWPLHRPLEAAPLIGCTVNHPGSSLEEWVSLQGRTQRERWTVHENPEDTMAREGCGNNYFGGALSNLAGRSPCPLPTKCRRLGPRADCLSKLGTAGKLWPSSEMAGECCGL